MQRRLHSSLPRCRVALVAVVLAAALAPARCGVVPHRSNAAGRKPVDGVIDQYASLVTSAPLTQRHRQQKATNRWAAPSLASADSSEFLQPHTVPGLPRLFGNEALVAALQPHPTGRRSCERDKHSAAQLLIAPSADAHACAWAGMLMQKYSSHADASKALSNLVGVAGAHIDALDAQGMHDKLYFNWTASRCRSLSPTSWTTPRRAPAAAQAC